MDTLKMLKDTIGREAILIGNSAESNYSFSKALKLPPDNTKYDKFEDLLNKKQSGTTIIRYGIPFDSIGNMVYQNKKAKKVFVREKMTNEYVLTEEVLPTINWQITDEIRTIKNYSCKIGDHAF